MSSSTGWVVAIGAITLGNQIMEQDPSKGVNYVSIPVATAVGATIVTLIEKTGVSLGPLVAVAFVTAMVAPLAGHKSPVENIYSLFTYYTSGTAKVGTPTPTPTAPAPTTPIIYA